MMENTYLNELNATDSNTPKFTLNGLKTIAKCVHVYDGDTAHFTFRPFVGSPIMKFSCRMFGYNSAELRGVSNEEKEAGQLSKKILSSLINDSIVTLHIYEFDKYGRPLVDVYIDLEEGITLHINKWMIEHKYGVEYFGEGEKRW